MSCLGPTLMLWSHSNPQSFKTSNLDSLHLSNHIITTIETSPISKHIKCARRHSRHLYRYRRPPPAWSGIAGKERYQTNMSATPYNAAKTTTSTPYPRCWPLKEHLRWVEPSFLSFQESQSRHGIHLQLLSNPPRDRATKSRAAVYLRRW